MKTIDAKGKLCPMPLIMTKKALGELTENESLEVIMDNETSVKNVTRYLEELGMKPTIEKKGSNFHVFVNKTGEVSENVKVEDFCTIDNDKLSDYIISFQKNKLGEGSDELGTILAKAFINTLPEIDVKPKKLIFLNSGIYLALKDSPVIDTLKKLEEMGIEILVCGTCLDYFKKKEELGVGIVSNMYVILESLSKASKVIYP
ncbi:MAG: sulfurtransferase-like selenium metabolism protein YedF [Bacteroidales bacterium]|jgi:selenium metabolism protein YedF|nr:sulfurtransferase-like selenium metabolism protein YedF [Bacteroidales bacterium]